MSSRKHLPLALALGLAGPVVVLAPLGLATLLAAAACGRLALTWREQPWRRLGGHMTPLFILLTIWAGVSASWSDQPLQSLQGTLSLAGTLLAGQMLFRGLDDMDDDARRLLARAGLIGMGLGLLLLAGFTLRAHLTAAADFNLMIMLSRHSRAAIVLILLLWPCLLLLERRSRAAMVALGLVTGIVAAYAGSGSAKLALAVGIGCGLLGALAPARGSRLVGAVYAVLVLLAPLGGLGLGSAQDSADRWPSLSPSALHRAAIWSFTAQNIAERPLLGRGMEASRWIPGADDEVLVRVHAPGNEFAFTASQLPLHPHNAPLQFWLELGLPGALLLACGAILAARGVASLPGRIERGLALAALGAALSAGCVSFGAWQKWWLAALWMVALLVRVAVEGRGRTTPTS